MTDIGGPEQPTAPETKTNPVREASRRFLLNMREGVGKYTIAAIAGGVGTLLPLTQGDVGTTLIRGLVVGALLYGLGRAEVRQQNRVDQRAASPSIPSPTAK